MGFNSAFKGLMPSSAMTWARQHRITKLPNRSFEPNACSTKTGHRECGTCYVYLGNKDTCCLKCSVKSLLHSYKMAVVPSFYIFWLMLGSFLEHVHTLKCVSWRMSYGRPTFFLEISIKG